MNQSKYFSRDLLEESREFYKKEPESPEEINESEHNKKFEDFLDILLNFTGK